MKAQKYLHMADAVLVIPTYSVLLLSCLAKIGVASILELSWICISQKISQNSLMAFSGCRFQVILNQLLVSWKSSPTFHRELGHRVFRSMFGEAPHGQERHPETLDAWRRVGRQAKGPKTCTGSTNRGSKRWFFKAVEFPIGFFCWEKRVQNLVVVTMVRNICFSSTKQQLKQITYYIISSGIPDTVGFLFFPHITVGFLFSCLHPAGRRPPSSAVVRRRPPPRSLTHTSQNLSHHTQVMSHHTQLIPHHTPLISHTTHLTQHSSHTHTSQNLSHTISYTTHLTHLISYITSHTTHLTHTHHQTYHTHTSSHTSHHTPLISHTHTHITKPISSYTSHLTSYTTHPTHNSSYTQLISQTVRGRRSTQSCLKKVWRG